MARGTWGGSGDVHPVKVQFRFTLRGVQCQTGFKLRDQSLTPLNVEDAAEDVADFFNDNFRALLSSEDRFLGVDAVDMTTGESGTFSYSNVVGSNAYGASSAIPTFITAPISLKGELRRRYGRGGMLWPIRSDSWVDENIMTAGGVAAFQAVIDAMVTRYMGSGTYRLINAHGVIPPKPATTTTPARPEVPATWYDVTSIRLNTTASFLRSRKLGVGV